MFNAAIYYKSSVLQRIKNELIFQNLLWFIKSIDMHGQQDDRNALIILPFTDIKRFVLIT